MESLMNIGNEFYQAIKEHYPMSSSAKSLDEMMRESLQDGGYAVSGGRDLFMEVMETTTGLVWMSAAPVQLADYEALELEASMVKVGIARAPMDRAAFQYSPGAPEAPVLERVIDGRLYINVAAPLEQTPSALPGHAARIDLKFYILFIYQSTRRLLISLAQAELSQSRGSSHDNWRNRYNHHSGRTKRGV
jgi:hypothetical protein